MRLLVTGGTGFLGQRVVRAAQDAGHEPTVLSRDRRRAEELPPGTRVVQGQITDSEDLQAALDEARPDAVIHGAAVVDSSHPALREVNVGGTEALVAAARGLDQPPRIVLVSSFAVEDIPPTAYSQSKLEAERLLQVSSLPFVVLRPTLIYGPGDRTNTPRVIERMARGTHWLPGGGKARIQPVHVDDVASACVRAASQPGIEGRTFRLGGPDPISVRDWREALRDATGGVGRVRCLPLALLGPAARLLAALGRPGPLAVLAFHRSDHLVDSSAARHHLAFQPRPLADGLAGLFGRG